MLNSSYWINYKVAKYFNLKTKHNYYFWLHWVFVAAWATSQRGQRGLLSSCGTGCSQCWPLLMRSAGSSAQAPVAVAPTLSSTGSIMWCVGLVAQQNVGFSQIRDQTHVSCIGRWILYHRAIRETPNTLHFKYESNKQVVSFRLKYIYIKMRKMFWKIKVLLELFQIKIHASLWKF